jgi:hypothetical protein
VSRAVQPGQGVRARSASRMVRPGSSAGSRRWPPRSGSRRRSRLAWRGHEEGDDDRQLVALQPGQQVGQRRPPWWSGPGGHAASVEVTTSASRGHGTMCAARLLPVDFATMMALEPHGTDVWVGPGRATLGWAVRRADRGPGLRAGGFTVDPMSGPLAARVLHPLGRPHRADPVRGGPRAQRAVRSAPAGHGPRQSTGVILEMTAVVPGDEAARARPRDARDCRRPATLADDSWGDMFPTAPCPWAGRGVVVDAGVHDPWATTGPCRRWR